MPSRIYDRFNRNPSTSPVALGTAESGQPWGVIGTVQIVNNRAVAQASGAALIDPGVGGEDGAASCGLSTGGGQALYFRADATLTSYWSAVQRLYTYQYKSGTETYVSGYTQVQVGTETYISGYETVLVGYQDVLVGYNYFTKVTYIKMNPVTGVFIPSDSPQYEPPYDKEKAHYYPTPGYPHFRNDFPDEPSNSTGHVFRAFSPVYRNTPAYESQAIYEQRAIYSTRPVYQSQPIYSTRDVYSTATGYELLLQRLLLGTATVPTSVTTIKSLVIPGPFASLRAEFNADKITCFAGSGSVSVVDSSLSEQRHVGFGLAAATEQPSTTGIDDFSYAPVNTGGYLPPVLP